MHELPKSLKEKKKSHITPSLRNFVQNQKTGFIHSAGSSNCFYCDKICTVKFSKFSPPYSN